MVLSWAAWGGVAGFYALQYENIRAASQIGWFVLVGAVLGALAMLVGRLIPGGRDSGVRVLGGAATGAVALATVIAVTWKHSWGGMVLMSVFGFFTGAVLGFGFTVMSLALEQHGPWAIFRAILDSMKDPSGR
ncbi:MAG TPA: hypothetical protein VG406_10460 [Isosphaeraceae bacterium]|jgi:hypothetical protein|nr:hypothetical protein [Isosphaeraceae bacterium]